MNIEIIELNVTNFDSEITLNKKFLDNLQSIIDNGGFIIDIVRDTARHKKAYVTVPAAKKVIEAECFDPDLSQEFIDWLELQEVRPLDKDNTSYYIAYDNVVYSSYEEAEEALKEHFYSEMGEHNVF